MTTLHHKLTCQKDIEFASIMIQNLNNNLITAPELADLRKRLRNLDTKVRIFQVLNTLKLIRGFRMVHHSS